jgi:hypothetical protein
MDQKIRVSVNELFILLVIGSLPVLMVLVIWRWIRMADRAKGDRTGPRGFEVKLTKAKEPVMEQKESEQERD